MGLAGFGFWVHTPIMQWGARWLTPDYKTVVCDSQQTIDAFTKFDDLLFKDRVTAQSPGANLGSGNAFLTGKAAVNMPCCALNFARSTRGQNIEWAFITMPWGTVSTLDVSPVVMGIAKTSKQKEAPGSSSSTWTTSPAWPSWRTACPGCCRTCCPGSRATSPSGRTRGRRCWRRG